ncbi:hypothetical protein Lal_00039408 [Lupinus albus]|nr:hypothetical protein Lal_00039408 [Lupinus albus]
MGEKVFEMKKNNDSNSYQWLLPRLPIKHLSSSPLPPLLPPNSILETIIPGTTKSFISSKSMTFMVVTGDTPCPFPKVEFDKTTIDNPDDSH